MVRVPLILCLVLATAASAAPPEYTLPPLPESWQDITAQAMTQAPMIAQRDNVIKGGGTFDATMYAGDASGMLVVRSEFGGATATRAELDGFMTGFRSSGRQGAKERSWTVEPSPTMLVALQHLDRDGTQATTKGFAGFTSAGALRTLSFFCFGGDAICDPLLAKITVDNAGMQPLAGLRQPETQDVAYRLGRITGMALVGLLLAGFLWRRSRRARSA